VRNHAALAHLSQLARLGLPSRTVIPEMLKALADLIPSHFCMFVWVDRLGRPVDFHLPWIIPAALEVNAALLACDDMKVPSFASLVRRGKPFGVAAETTRMPEFRGSLFYNECCRPYGIGHGFDVFVHEGQEVCGVVLATREPGSCDYSRREIELLIAVVPAFAHALAADRLDLPDDYADSSDRTVLTLDGDGHLIEASRGYETVLRALLGIQFDQKFRRRTLEEALPDFFAPLIRRAGREPAVARTTPYGRMVVRLYPVEPPLGLSQDGGAVEAQSYYALIERQIPLGLKVLSRLAELDLSPREREVARHLVLARAPGEIMRDLGIGAHTLHDYRRRIYRRVGVASREELERRVLGST
jgi:DNA-binding CsgD family transcriptional regulator